MKKITSILIIDDSESEHIIAKYAIEAYDAQIQIYSAFDGQEALDLLTTLTVQPDVILLDINMPGMDGHEFLVEYEKTDYKSSVVAMLTSSDQESDRKKCLKYPFVRQYLFKPLEVKDLQTIAGTL
jgi:CheY-like chemotaxis protein